MDGETLRERRSALGLTQAELGQRFGVMQQTVARWERLAAIERGEMMDLALRFLELEHAAALSGVAAVDILGLEQKSRPVDEPR